MCFYYNNYSVSILKGSCHTKLTNSDRTAFIFFHTIKCKSSLPPDDLGNSQKKGVSKFASYIKSVTTFVIIIHSGLKKITVFLYYFIHMS